MKPHRHWANGGRALLAAAMASTISTPAVAIEFSNGELSGSLDTTISYGLRYRVQERDPELLGRASAPFNGSGFSVNSDDGNQNFNTGLVSEAVKLTSELDVNYRNFNFFMRVLSFYDYEIEKGDRAKYQLTPEAREKVGSDTRLLDFYATYDFELFDKPALVRFGDHVLSWGESTFIPNGINIINPIDVSAIRTPGAEVREALLPEGLVSGVIDLSDRFTVEGFYQYDWNETEIDPVGSYFSSRDFLGEGGDRVLLGFGDLPDGGRTDPSQVFNAVSRSADVRPDNNDQFGVALRVFAPELNNTEFGLYYISYHSRLPLLNAVTGTDAGLNAARAILIANPGNPNAAALASDTYVKTASYFAEYPENINLTGLSFNTELGTSGIALQGEFSFRRDQPLQIDDIEVVLATLSPLSPVARDNQLSDNFGPFGTNEVVRGFIQRDVSQLQMTASKLFPQVLGADQVTVVGEVGITHVHHMPNKDVLRLDGPGTTVSGNPNQALATGAHPGKEAEGSEHFADATSWGYRLLMKLDYNAAIGPINLAPRIAYSHDVNGITPAPLGNFLEGRRATTVAVEASYQSEWTAEVAYTNFFGAGRYNLINDRDFIALNVKYAF